MNLYDDDPPPPRLQPGTKLAIVLIAGCLFLALAIGITAAARSRDSSENPRPAVARSPSRPAPRPVAPTRSRSESEDDAFDAATRAEKEVAASILGFSLIVFAAIIASSLVWLLTTIFMLVWVARDARARGLDGGVWVIVLFLGHFLGLIAYLASRPAGLLSACRHCNGTHLVALRYCPHCGHRGKRQV